MAQVDSKVIQLGGSLSITGTTITNSYDNAALTYGYVEAERATLQGSDSIYVTTGNRPNNVVKFTGNINAFVTHHPSGADGVDDAWSLAEISYNGSDITAAGNVTIEQGQEQEIFIMAFECLETTNSIQIGNITITDDSTFAANSNVGGNISPAPASATWTMTLSTTISDTGTLSFVVPTNYSSTSDTFTITAAGQTSLYEQKIYASTIWSNLLSEANEQNPATTAVTETATGTGVDTFSVTFTNNGDAASADGAGTALVAAIESETSPLSGNTLISAVSFTINEIPPSNTSTLSAYANTKGKNGESATPDLLFDANDEVYVGNNGAPITTDVHLTMNDYAGNVTNVSTLAFAIKLVQS